MSFHILTESGFALLTESGVHLVTEYSMPCDPDVLISDAKMIECCIPKGMQMAVLISLFCQLNNMSCDSQTLINNALCTDQCIPDGDKMAVLINLACQIVQNGGGGGGGGQEVFPAHYGGVPPVFVPDLNRGLAPDLDAPYPTYIWNPDTQTWS